jgi:hypothetical protein
VGDGLGADRMSLGPLDVDGVLEVAGRGEDAGVDDEGEAVGLSGLVVVVAVADGTPVSEVDEPAQVVEGLAPIELTADPSSEGLVGEPAKGVEGAQQLAVLRIPANPDGRSGRRRTPIPAESGRSFRLNRKSVLARQIGS